MANLNRLCVFVLLGLMLFVPCIAIANATWSDGTPIVRFDKRDDAPMDEEDQAER